MDREIGKAALSDHFGQAANITSIPLGVKDFIHDGLDKPNTKPSLSFIVNQAIDTRLMKIIDVKHLTIIHDFEDYFTLLGNVNIQIDKMFRIAIVSMDHQVGTHLIESEDNLI
jgi:hypothetical protein